MTKDWTGNKKTMAATLGASNLTEKERAEWDYYATPSRAIDAIVLYLEKNIPIWECACGGGHLSKKLEEEGFKVFSSDIIKRDFECKEVDFLNYNKTDLNVNIVTNPPYKFAKEFAEKALEVIKNGKLVFLFLRIQFLESQKRRPLFEKKQLKYMLVYSKRTPQCARNGDFSNQLAMLPHIVGLFGKRGGKAIR